MKKRIGFGFALFILLAFLGAQAFAAPADSKGEPSPAKKTGGLEFKVFDTASLLAEWGITCSDGSQTSCSGSMEYCLGYCHAFCGGPCVCVSGCEV